MTQYWKHSNRKRREILFNNVTYLLHSTHSTMGLCHNSFCELFPIPTQTSTTLVTLNCWGLRNTGTLSVRKMRTGCTTYLRTVLQMLLSTNTNHIFSPPLKRHSNSLFKGMYYLMHLFNLLLTIIHFRYFVHLLTKTRSHNLMHRNIFNVTHRRILNVGNK